MNRLPAWAGLFLLIPDLYTLTSALLQESSAEGTAGGNQSDGSMEH